jgi:hypothetical protein
MNAELDTEENVLRSEASFFAEWDFVQEFIAGVCSSGWEVWAAAARWERLSAVLLVFQEQPSLLSPYLEEIVVPLTARLIGILEEGEGRRGGRFQVSE